MRNALPFLLLFVVRPASAQDTVPDTLGTDSARVVGLNKLCFKYSDLDPDKGLGYGRRALALAQRIGFPEGEAQSHGYIGYCLTRKSAFDSAQAAYERSIALYDRLKDPCGAAGMWYNVGLNHQMLQQEAQALEIFLRVLKTEEKCPTQQQRSTRLYAIGSVYANMQRYKEALPYYQEAIALDSAAHDTTRLAKEHVAIANAYSGTGRLEEALASHDRSVKYSLAIGDSLTVAYVHYNVSKILASKGDLPAAVERAELSYNLLVRLKRAAESAHAAINLANLYSKADRAKEADTAARHALHIADSLGLVSDRIYAMLAVATAKEGQGDASAALAWYKRYVHALEQSNTEERDRQLNEMTTRFETEKKEKALEASRLLETAARAETEHQRTLKFAYLGGAALLGVLLVLFIARFRSKRRAAEELERVNAEVLRQKDRAEESERAKDRFLANVSHEIRTPLNAIMGFTGLLLHEHRDERTTRYLTNIREAGDNLLVVINDVLDLSRIEAGRLQLVKEPFDLHRTVRLCAEILQHRAEEQGNTFTTNVAWDVPQWVMGDSARVLQVLLNLAGNALKFTQGGTVGVGVRMGAAGIRFTVRDNGIGIPKEKLPDIFDRFTQVDVNDQRKYGGTGLGLSIVKELVDLHKGNIHVHSAHGQGTTFTVDLPLVGSPAPAIASQRAVSTGNGSLASRTILVAEDNDMNALVTTETLRRYYPAAQTVVVRTGQEALDHMVADTDHDIALVLMDVQMPVMDGMTATRRIRAINGDAARVPIIALTASVLPSDLSRCLDAGMDACVPKPFKADELLRAIGQVTGDSGAPAGIGFDVHDPNVALYHWLVPQRLKALRTALAQDDAIEVRNIVHALRPQLIERDRATFDEPTARLLRDKDPQWKPNAQALVELVQTTLT
ncbi:MAG: response regulator [Flavobacteriales bacterium]|nr:MAG: response regulator [Flavobacteriales bacterium]